MTDLERLAEQLARKHRIPKATVTHPAVIVPGDEFMTDKLKDPDYVPYCLKGVDCGRVRRTAYGFKCPTCGNQVNYDLTHYNGNKHVQYVGEPPPPEVALAGFPPAPGEYWKFRSGRIGPSGLPPGLAEYRAQHAEINAWNDAVEAKKLAKRGRK